MKSNPLSLQALIVSGFIIGLLIYCIDSDKKFMAPYSAEYSNFIKATEKNPQTIFYNQQVLTAEAATSSVWFFRKYPDFLIWSLMHIIGVSLCFVIGFIMLKKIIELNKIIKKFGKAISFGILSIVIIIAPLLFLVYRFAYSFDYVAFLMPLKNAGYKIYAFEGLNYFTGAICLVIMAMVSRSLHLHNAVHDDHESLLKLKKYFANALYCAAIVIGFSTLAGGQLYKSLNYFYKDLYGSETGHPYFPNQIIYSLGLFNSFLLAVFFVPIIPLTVRQPALSSEKRESKISIFGSLFHFTEPFLENIKSLLAILTPLFAAIFSTSI